MLLVKVTAASAFSRTAAESVATFTSACSPSVFSSAAEAITVEADDSESKGGCRLPVATSGPFEIGLDATPSPGEDEVSAPDGASTTEGVTIAEAGGFIDVSGCVPMKDAFSTSSRANLKQKHMQSRIMQK